MRTLELKDICGYLPHELKIICTDKTRHGDLDYYGRIYTLTPILVGGTLRDAYSLPILRPVSDMYKPIIHNGKEQIPIIECAKMARPNLYWLITQYNTAEAKLNNGSDYAIFQFNEFTKNFGLFYDNEIGIIPNQYQLFDYLHELKIDYRGLIDAGLAIDANTLEINPYK
jgi:hypothetical protein